MKVKLNGYEVNYVACALLMDDNIREELHRELSPCTAQEFLDAYVDCHREMYGEDFEV